MNAKLCDTCGHTIERGTDHGFGRVMVGDCLDCPDCEAAFAATPAETIVPGPGEDGFALTDEAEAEWRLANPDATTSDDWRREDAVFEREERRARDLDDGILYADDL